MATAKTAPQPGTIVICASDAPRDRAFTRRLARDLSSMGYTPLYHRDRGEVPRPASDIERAQAVLVVLSPQLQGSAVARTEYLYAVQLRKLIIPLQTDIEPQIPPELGNIQWVDFYEVYARGLAKLAHTLGQTQEALLRRMRLATFGGRVIPLVRTGLAALMLAIRLMLANSFLFPLNHLWAPGWWVVLLPPAVFAEIGEEDYRRGDAPGKRITLARILLGSAGGALLGLSTLLVLPSNTTFWLVVISTPAAGFLAWLFTQLEQRSLRRGRLGIHRTLGLFRFCAKAVIIFLALLTFDAPGAPRPVYQNTEGVFAFATNIGTLDPQVAVLVLGTLMAVSVIGAATLEWLRSPVHRVKRARRQLVEASKGTATAVAAPVVFISHASGDNDFAIKLSHDLQQRGVATWVDRRQLEPGMIWPDEIRHSLDGARIVLLVLSPLAVKSNWVRREYQAALTQGKDLIVLRLDASSPVPNELNRVRSIDFATLYSSGLSDLLAALHADPQTVAAAQRTLRQRLRYAWLISTVRLVASSYLFLARILVFGIASFTLLGGFDRIAGLHDLATYALIWIARAVPGVALGAFVSVEERARVDGAQPTRWVSLARIVNGAMTGEGLLGVWALGIGGVLFAPVTWLSILFISNLAPGDLLTTGGTQQASGSTFTGVMVALVIGLGIVNGALANPLARSEQRNREQGKRALIILARIAGYAARVGIGMLGVAAPLYLLFDSPIAPFGPPPPDWATQLGIWALSGLAVGAIAGAIELFFFPAGPSRQALRKLRTGVPAKAGTFTAP